VREGIYIYHSFSTLRTVIGTLLEAGGVSFGKGLGKGKGGGAAAPRAGGPSPAQQAFEADQRQAKIDKKADAVKRQLIAQRAAKARKAIMKKLVDVNTDQPHVIAWGLKTYYEAYAAAQRANKLEVKTAEELIEKST